MKQIRIGGFFSGIGSHVSACDRLKDRAQFVQVFQCEFDAKSAMYKFAGNAVCVDCFVRITEQILDDMENAHADKGGLDYWMGLE